MSTEKPSPDKSIERRGFVVRALDFIEWAGNKLPDPAVLFLIGLIVTWLLSWWLSNVQFTETRPNSDEPIQIVNMLTLENFATFLTGMVNEFAQFPPLGIVLVALLGVGVAEHSGFINACLKSLLNVTPLKLLTPMLILVAIISHSAADAGYVLVIPIGGVMFYAAGRHPLAGIAAAFAGVSGGFSANFVPSGLDPLLSGLTQTGVDIVDKDHIVNPLCNYFFTTASSILIILVGWFLTDRVVEPKLRTTPVDGDSEEMPQMEELSSRDKFGMWMGLGSIVVGLAALIIWAWPLNSELRDASGSLISYVNKVNFIGIEFEPDQFGTVRSVADGSPAANAGVAAGDKLNFVDGKIIVSSPAYFRLLRDLNPNQTIEMVMNRDGQSMTFSMQPQGVQNLPGASLMRMIVPLIFFLFIVPGLVHGFASGRFKSHRDAVSGMAKTMETMGYYLVLVFFAALFIAAFRESGIGELLAIKGANFIKESGASPAVTITGIIILAACVNLLVGSASAKWAMLAPIFVPMLMLSGFSPELTQAAYRVGDSTTNIITPMMPYFPLVVVFSQRYVKNTGIGTVASMMLPYSITFIILWTLFLMVYWSLGLPLGIQADYVYPTP